MDRQTRPKTSYPDSGRYSEPRHDGAAFAHDQQGPRADDEILSQVQAALIEDPRVDAENVRVDVDHAVVILRGDVTSSEAREAADEAVRRLEDVRDVRNELTVAG